MLYLGPRSGAPEHPWTHLVDDLEDPTIRRFVYSGTGDPFDRASDLDACETEDVPPPIGDGYLGFDLGSTASLSAAVCYWPASRRLQVWAGIGDQPSPSERGSQDGVGALYGRAVARGELWTLAGPGRPRRRIPHPRAAGHPARGPVAAVGADRYRLGEEPAGRAGGRGLDGGRGGRKAGLPLRRAPAASERGRVTPHAFIAKWRASELRS